MDRRSMAVPNRDGDALAAPAALFRPGGNGFCGSSMKRIVPS
jgi:hypothetical protein